MKDYSLNKEEEKRFILNYDIVDDKIIVKLASGEKYTVPYTRENEMEILDKMKAQVLNSRAAIEHLNSRFSFACLEGLCAAILFLLIIAGGVPFTFMGVACVTLFGLNTIIEIFRAIDSKLKIKDIEKNRMFLENEELLNQGTSLNEEELSNEKNETNKMDFFVQEKPVLSLNDIDNMSYDELKSLIDEAKEYQEQEVSYNQDEKPMTLTKKQY